MVPSPPRLEDSVGDWSDEELFWIVKNGFKYTGMPAWPAQGRDDEVWTQVAFLRALPDITAATYADLALGGGTVDYDLEAGGQALVALDGIFENALENCARCQGRDGLGQGQGAASGAFPIIAGQPAPYLSATLQPSRKAGVKAASCSLPQAVMMRRPSLNLPDTLPDSPAPCRNPAPTRVPTGTQRHRHLPAGPPLDTPQDAAEILEGDTDLGYATVPMAAPGGTPSTPEALLALGQRIALDGIAEAGIPSCQSCHGQGSQPQSPDFPAFAGQPTWYLAESLM